MSYDYDKLYGTTPRALGEPTAVIVNFFKNHSGNDLRVLDIGCGQGRDALFIARLGHLVVGVDLSPKGIGDLVEVAKRENLKIKGIVADVVDFAPDGKFDVLLIDRTLHMLSNTDRQEVLARLICCVAEKGWALIADERSNILKFKETFKKSAVDWKIIFEDRGVIFLQRS